MKRSGLLFHLGTASCEKKEEKKGKRQARELGVALEVYEGDTKGKGIHLSLSKNLA